MCQPDATGIYSRGGGAGGGGAGGGQRIEQGTCLCIQNNSTLVRVSTVVRRLQPQIKSSS